MSWSPCPDPVPGDAASVDAIETLIVPRAVDLGEMTVRRALPSTERQMVGPFIFFDQMGPAEFLTDQGIDVRPHPHINLATLTYLIEGEILHRDSLGTERAIRARRAQLDARRGAASSTPNAPTEALQARPASGCFGLQTWVALPQDLEEESDAGLRPPRRRGRPARSWTPDGAMRRAADRRQTPTAPSSPLATASETLYADIALSAPVRDPPPIEPHAGGTRALHDPHRQGRGRRRSRSRRGS